MSRESNLDSAATDIQEAVRAAFFWTVGDVDGASFVVATGDRGSFRVSVTAGDYDFDRDEIRDALEGESNDAEHDALVTVADVLGIDYTPFDDQEEDE
jgi:hypothetical protein